MSAPGLYLLNMLNGCFHESSEKSQSAEKLPSGLKKFFLPKFRKIHRTFGETEIF